VSLCSFSSVCSSGRLLVELMARVSSAGVIAAGALPAD
jgi:hypothetical protein